MVYFKLQDSERDGTNVDVKFSDYRGILLPRETRNSLFGNNKSLNTCELLSTAIQYNAEKTVCDEKLSHPEKVLM